MQKKKLSGKGLVIQLSAREMRVARLTLGTAMPQITNSTTVPLPEGCVEDGMIRQPAVLQTLLGNVVAAPEFSKVQQVVFTLCTSQVITETVSVPLVQEKKMDQLLSANMDLYFPVNPQDYQMVWQIVGPGKENGEADVELWAVPKSILAPYYTVANACGLTVAAISYCGDSLAAAAGISYAVPTPAKSRGKALPPAEQQNAAAPAADVTLYLTAEEDQMLMTFAQSGRIRMQRVLLCSGNHYETLSEAAMVMDYYLTMNPGARITEVILSGGQVQNGPFVDAVVANLGLPTRALPCKPGPEWSLCLGASHANLDFGDSALNRVKTVTQQLGVAWHYVFVLAGGALLAGAIVFLFAGKTNWDSTLNSLRAREQSTQLQAAQTVAEASRYEEEAKVYEGYALNYAAYLNDYGDYSQDWDSLFASLRTYNDNLKLALTELETILPTTTSVTQIYIADNGLYLQFACPDKEEAAYVFSRIRNMQYADLALTSDLTVGPPQTDTSSWLSSLGGLKPVSSIIVLETPPEEGGSDTADFTLLLLQVQTSDKLSDTFKAALNEVVDKYRTTHQIETRDLMTLYNAMEAGERDEFVDAYAELLPLPAGKTLADLLNETTPAQRKPVIQSMINNDPAADYRLMKLILNDYSSDQRLSADVYQELMNNQDLQMAAISMDMQRVLNAMSAIAETLTKDEETISGFEALVQTDPSMSRMYAHHLAVSRGLVEGKDLRDTKTLAELLRTILGIETTDPTNPTNPTNPTDPVNPADPTNPPPGGQDPEDPNPPQEELTELTAYLQTLYQKFSPYMSSEDRTMLEYYIAHPDKIDQETLLAIIKRAQENYDKANTPQPEPNTDLIAYIQGIYQQFYNFIDILDRKTLEYYMEHPDEVDQQVLRSIAEKAQNNYNEWLKSQSGSGGSGGGGGGGTPVLPADDRTFFTVMLAYNPELIQAELERKGLSAEDKISALEVPAE